MTSEMENPTALAVQGELVGSGVLSSAASTPEATLHLALLQQQFVVRRAHVRPELASVISSLYFGEARDGQ